MQKHLIILLSILTFASCRNVNAPSTVDTKQVGLEENMDKSVKPGDDFYMYSNGAWWNNTTLGGYEFLGFVSEATDIATKRIAQLKSPTIDAFWAQATNVDNSTVDAVALIKQHLALVDKISTTDEANDVIVKMILAGYDNLILQGLFFKEGQTRFSISVPNKVDINSPWIMYSLTELGVANAYNTVMLGQDLQSQLMQGQTPVNLSFKNLEDNPEVSERMVSLQLTKADNSNLLKKILEAVGLNAPDVVIDENMTSLFTKLDQASPESIKSLLYCYIADNYKYTSTTNFESYSTYTTLSNNLYTFLDEFKEKYMEYIYAHAFNVQYVTPERKALFKLYCEDFRSTFRQRILHLDWMSGTTKQNALDKLDAMAFSIGSPDVWCADALPSLTGTSLLENMFTIVKARHSMLKSLTNRPAQEASFHYLYTESPVQTINAFYIPSINSINILPAWLLSPMYEDHLSDAYNYAVLSVVAHEITHGFDNEGSKYNKVGKLENWWTVADHMEFSNRQQKLVDCYNLLEIMPLELPGTFSNGQKTLGENIADLGGLQIAYQAYNTRLQSEGYKDEELENQQKKFFQAYSNLSRGKYTPVFAMKMLQTDEHALSKERVNGVVMNMDQWYDLYDVQWGDKLYLKPEKRTNIW